MWFKRVIYFSRGNFLKQSEFRFIIFLYFKITYLLFKFNYIYYHIGQLLIHSLNACLIFIIAYNFIFSKNFWLAILAALYFCVSYPKYEAVMWINGINDVLCTTFCLLSFIYFFKNKNLYFLIFSILAVFTKPTALIMPVILFLADLLLYSDLKHSRKNTFGAMFSVAIFFTFLYLKFFSKQNFIFLIKNILFSLYLTLFYFSEHFLSFLGFVYYPLKEANINLNKFLLTDIYFCLAGLLLIFLKAVIILFKQNKFIFSNNPQLKILIFLLLASLLSLFLPMLKTPYNSSITYIPLSRYQYFPAVWFSLLITLVIFSAVNLISSKKKNIMVLLFLFFCTPLFLNFNLTLKMGKNMQKISEVTKYLTYKAWSSYKAGAKECYFINLPYAVEKFHSPHLKDLVYIITDNKLQIIFSHKIPKTLKKNTKIFLYDNNFLKPLN